MFYGVKHSSNNDIHYFPLCSVPYLIDYYSAGCMPLSSHQWQHHSSGSGHTRYAHSALSPLKWKMSALFPISIYILISPSSLWLYSASCWMSDYREHCPFFCWYLWRELHVFYPWYNHICQRYHKLHPWGHIHVHVQNRSFPVQLCCHGWMWWSL